MRNVIGSVLAVLGAAATLVSPWQSWYAGRHGSTYKFWEVFGTGVTPSRSGIMDSVFLVFLITALVTVAGIVMRSRTAVLVAGIVAFGFSVLWMVRQGNAAGELVITNKGTGLGQGVAWAFTGSVAMIVGACLMTGRPREVAAPVPASAAGASTKAYDSGRSDAKAATSSTAVPTTAPATTSPSGTAALTPEEQAMIDKLNEPPKS
jgi:hypothetical protein